MATIPAALRPRLSRRAIAFLLVSALALPLAAGAGWLAFSGDSALGEMELAARGDVTVLRAGETIAIEDAQFELEAGDVVTTGEIPASAEFKLVDDRNVEMAAASSVRIVGASAFAVEAGSVLADTSDETSVTVGDVSIASPSSDAIFRMDRSSALRTGVYEGVVELSVPAQGSLRLRELFEVSMPLAAPTVPARPDPYSLDASDGWDGVHLENVIRLDQSLSTTARGLATQFEGKPPLSYFQAVAGSQVKFMKPYLKHKPADLLVGLTVAQGASSNNLAGAFSRTLDLVFERGATWGITAAIMGASPQKLKSGLSKLIEKSGVTGGKSPAAAAFALASGAGETSGMGGPSDVPGATTTTEEDDTGNEPIVDPTVKPTSSPSPSPSPTPDPTPTDPPTECGTDLECAVNDLDPPVDNPLEDDIGKDLPNGDDALDL